MSGSAKLFFSLFVLLALGALGHDIYIWQNSDGFPFAFAALGWISKNYVPDQHQLVVDTLTPETFNQILTPILKIPAFFLAAGLALTVFVIDFVNGKIKAMNPARGKDRDQKFKRR